MSFSSTNYINNIRDIPSEWILQNYLNISSHMIGHNFKIKSIFNPKDTDPSLSIYYKKSAKEYWFTDYSSGKKGSMIDLVMGMYNESFIEAVERITKDYINRKKSDYKVLDKEESILEETEWIAEDISFRKWNKKDAKYWSAYNISSKILNEYNVKPIQSITIKKIIVSTGEILMSFDIISRNYMYGYFQKDGTLYKLYRPYNKKKFLSLGKSYIQGVEQLKYKDSLVIASSLKDLMALKSIIPYVDLIASSSESSIIKAVNIISYKKSYEYIATLFDNDETGINSMKKYKELYKIPPCYIPEEKDSADILKIRKKQEALRIIYPKLQKSLIEYKLLNSEENEE